MRSELRFLASLTVGAIGLWSVACSGGSTPAGPAVPAAQGKPAAPASSGAPAPSPAASSGSSAPASVAVQSPTAGAATSAPAKPASGSLETVKLAYLEEISHHAVLWAIQNGKVTSDKIKVETQSMGIPALIQATGAKQFDVVETSNLAIPRLLQQGLQIKIVATALRQKQDGTGLFVKAGSPIKSGADLKGKTMGLEGIGSSYGMVGRLVLYKKYGLNVSTEGGDVKYVDAPMSNLPGLLQQGRIDAGLYSHVFAYESRKSPEFAELIKINPEWKSITNSDAVTAVLISYPEKLQQRAEAMKEFVRLLKASRDYINTHEDEVFGAIAKQYNSDPVYLKSWFDKQQDFPATVTDGDVKALDALWSLAKEAGQLPDYPKASDVLWTEGIIRQ